MLDIFNIQRFSTHDGEGIRTNIFFKACPLKCPWCSNPESRSHKPELLFDKKQCNRFEECIKASNGSLYFEKDQLMVNKNPGFNLRSLKSVCPSKALSIAGEFKSVEQLLHEVEKDLPFYESSDGGVTLTGGEPLLQSSELLNLVKALKESHINIAIETSLNVAWVKIHPLIEFVDCWLADLKHINPQKFKSFTGGNANLIMENFKKLDKENTKIIVRIPVVPGFNSAKEELQGMIDFVTTLRTVKEVHFMPYHTYGGAKYTLMNIENPYNNYKSIASEELDDIVHYANKKGLKTKIGG